MTKPSPELYYNRTEGGFHRVYKNHLKLRTPDLFGNYDNLGYAVESEYVLDKDHPDTDLTLYVYDNSCVFEHAWDNVTKQCRGLIVGPGWTIVALPFPKTFLVDIHEAADTNSKDAPKYVDPLPKGEFRVTTKVDGSLAIIFWFEGKWRVATKGSFFSDHAVWGQAYLDARNTDGLDRNLTYLAEMIIPEWGRIVVDNGDREDMVLLGARSLYTGAYQRMETLEWGWASIGSVVESWGTEVDPRVINDRVKSNHRPDDSEAKGVEFEGVVLQWPDGTMAKAKMSDYIALHGLFTETTELGIWRVLSSGEGLETMMSVAPDEMVDWIKRVARDLEKRKNALLVEAHKQFNKAYRLAEAEMKRSGAAYMDRSDFVKATRGEKNQGVLLSLYDDNTESLTEWAWKQVRPVGKVTYRKEDE